MPSTSCQSWDLQLGLCLRCDLPKDLNTIFTQKTEGNYPVQVCLQKGIQFLHEVKNFARAMSHIHLMVFFGFLSWGNSNAMAQKVLLRCLTEVLNMNLRRSGWTCWPLAPVSAGYGFPAGPTSYLRALNSCVWFPVTESQIALDPHV